MLVNLHTHTSRCRHACGTERDYIETAIRAGMEVLGFSDHAPILFPGSYYSTMRMYPEEAADYAETLLRLREEYSGRIQILIGYEIEYYPDLFEPTLRFLSQFPLDYLILGQHYLGNEIGSAYVSHGTDRVSELRRYVDQCCAGLETGRFTYLAHPDVFRFTGDPAVYRAEMERLCRKALETHTPLELNMLGADTQRHYPNEAFWQIAGACGNTAVIGCDAHKPESLAAARAELFCRDLADRCGIPVMEHIPLVKPL